ncbi:phosphate signaling complex protein PhoU [Methanogenium marinum]|uniref:Phosphate-specific transport system accessory protein PhoU n=1 Tax=Methanogenium marinum TaxID=348610 RepID=A0A9Q4PYS5_9EURY|nr:phosphate signaling complex protein PhoU [Methanogenium marinum]MDE4908547.1 phosphate signaling complex protein PhoU [Methanogenium marinum]
MTFEAFHAELDSIQARILTMAEHSLGMLTDGMTCLKTTDIVLGNDIMDRKNILSEMHEEIEERIMRVFTLYHPVADDLRRIVCYNVMNYSLYRIGRMGKDIAKNVLEDLNDGLNVSIQSLWVMSDMVVGMLEDIIRAFRISTVMDLDSLGRRDDKVDAMRTGIFRECLTYMMEDPRNIHRGIMCITVSRHLERCGDYACIMAEKIYFMVEGARVEIR